ncbi:kunitz-type protease inhibitor 1a [Gambusia affinis]|uniref:kunitz-type protease inhibitor 1a n=1 Tax=Gambusia affinis TaxID=33528 RepID=UPI001CDBCABB|nr:kunitz-type protease inhibitor 1a [Gambusia affinis]XP_043997795.1 kunitz-type protease inhibitor 1a [Gambusia affinis]
MNLLFGCHFAALFLVGFLHLTAGQSTAETCMSKFDRGKENFMLNANESVNEGATFLSSPKVGSYMDCVVSCCKDPRCNVALMEKQGEDTIKICYLFDCLYNKINACRFVKKSGYFSYVLKSLSKELIRHDGTTEEKKDSPPVAIAGHDIVAQPKESVTLSGFQSRDENVQTLTFKWTMVTVYPYAIIEDTSFPDQITVSNLTSGKYTFKLTVTDTAGQSDSTTINVLVLTPEESEHHCMVPKKVGPCRGSFKRWHYNAASEKCEEFIFGGCLENKNNYIKEDECKKACHGTGGPSGRGLHIAGEKCGAPCTADQFKCDNGCCVDRGLKCDETAQCTDGSDEKNCYDFQSNFRTLLDLKLAGKRVHCTDEPETGTCRDSFTKWYYDPRSQSCTRFNYGGCDGNENRFESQQQCMQECNGVTEEDMFDKQNKAEKQETDSNTSIIAIAIVLGIAIAIVLAILGYCWLKNRQPSHSLVSTSSKPL